MARLDKNKLSTWQRDLVNAMSDLMIDIGTPDSLILNAVNAKAAQACQVARIHVESPVDRRLIPCNYYGITFFGSGGGKDRVLSQLNYHFFWKVKEFYEERCRIYVEDAYKAMEEHLHTLDTKGAKDAYRLYNAPRLLSFESSDGTPEGLMSDREAFQLAKFGGTFFQNGEFVNYLKPKDKSRESFLSLTGEVFDHGDNLGKTIKGNKRSTSVHGVPASMLVHSTPSDIHKHGVFDIVCENLNRQFARRAFICYPDDNEKRPKLTSAAEMVEFYDNVNENGRDTILKWSNKFCEAVKDAFYKKEHFKIQLTKEARIKFFEYRIKCDAEAASIDDTHEGLKIEVGSRPWKMLKLAGLINMFEKDSNHVLDCDVLEMAIYQTEFFGSYYRKFYSHKEADDVQLVYEYFEKHLNEPIYATRMREEVRPVSKDRFAAWWRDNYPLLVDMAATDGNEFEEVKGQRNTKLFVMKKTLGGV